MSEPRKSKDIVESTSHIEMVDVGDDTNTMSASRYLRTRLSTLKPRGDNLVNPLNALRLLTRENWHFFLVAWFAWVWDAFDFFTVSVAVTPLAKDFKVSNTDITWGITLVLMLRSIGAIIFGLWGDRYGRKWPFIVNNILFIVLELGTGFAQNLDDFLACRALFGIAMGGLYGNAVATALEDAPEQARGILSGLFQIGYPTGYLLAVAFGRALVDTTSYGWRPLFWFGACPPVLIILYRYYLPETRVYQNRELTRRSASSTASGFFVDAKLAAKNHWPIFTYMVLLMAGLNFMSHGAQDFYPTMLVNQFGFNRDELAITQSIANIGAIIGGITAGHVSDYLGRRLTIIICCVIGCALLYPYTFTPSIKVIAPAFFMNVAVQGTYGVIPSHLLELSPGSLRSFVIGTSYQLGNLASSGSTTIQARIGENYPLPPGPTGASRFNYGLVICIFIGVSYFLVLILVVLGPERKGQSMEIEDTEEPTLKESTMNEATVKAGTACV